MSTDRDVNRIVRSWLEEGVTALPDRVLDTVVDRLPATPQRRAWWPVRRFRAMNTLTRFAAVAAAVAVVAVVGINILPRIGGFGGPGTPNPTPTPSPSPIALPASGILDPGTYYLDDPGATVTSGRFTFTVPAGWAAAPNGGWISKDLNGPGEVLLVTWIVSHVFADSCHWQGTLVDVGTTVAELASALMDQKGRNASASDVLLGGFAAKRIELSIPVDLDIATCDGGGIRIWAAPDDSSGLGLPTDGGSFAGSTDVVYVVDVEGNPLAVVARHMPATSAANLAELEAILASIRIEP